MTKLIEWLLAIGLFFGAYTAIITKQIQHDILDDCMYEIKILPIVLFALFAVSTYFKFVQFAMLIIFVHCIKYFAITVLFSFSCIVSDFYF